MKLIQSLKGDLWYLAKYLVRSADSVKGELGMALSRDFGRRVWSKSRSWPGVDSIRNSGNSNLSLPDLSQVHVIVLTDPLRPLYSRCVIVRWRFESISIHLAFLEMVRIESIWVSRGPRKIASRKPGVSVLRA